MTPMVTFLIDLFIKSTLVLAAAHIALFFSRRSSAGTRHLILSSALIALLALPLTTPILHRFDLPLLPVTPQNATPARADRLVIRTGPVEAAMPARTARVPVDAALAPASVEEADGSLEAGSTSGELSVPIVSFDWIRSWIVGHLTPPVLFVGLWLVGSLALLLHLLIGIARVQWIVDRALPLRDDETARLIRESTKEIGLEREPRLRLTPDLPVPIVWGLTAPVLLLPLESERWSDERREAVVLHELAHIARRDGITLILTRIATSLYWIHPLVWTAARLARRYCERACDDIVLEGGTRASEYADHLLAIARTLPARQELAAVTLAMSRRTEIEGRLMAILHPDIRRGSITRRTSLIAALLTLFIVIGISGVRLTADEPRQERHRTAASNDEPPSSDLEITVAGTNLAEIGDPWDETVSEKEIEDLLASVDSNTNWNTNWNTNTNWNINVSDDDRWRDADEERKSDSGKTKGMTEEARLWEAAWNAHQSDRYDTSIALFMKTAEMGYRPATSRYNVACGYAMKGDGANAVLWLQRAIDHGFDRWDLLRKDSDLDPIRSDPRFRAFLESLPSKPTSSAEKQSRSRTDAIIGRYAELRSRSSTDASEWGETGRALLGIRRLDEAESTLRRGIELSKSPPVVAMYNLACVEALRGNGSRALQWLDRAIDAGLDRTDKMMNDPDLASIRGTVGFESLVAKSKLLSLAEFQEGQKEHEAKGQRVERWRPAITRYAQYTSAHPDSGRAWWNLGWALHMSERYEPAINAFERALRLGYRTASSSYNIACGHARLGHRDLAFQWLERSSRAGFDLGDRIRWDEDLSSLRGDPRVVELFDRPAKGRTGGK